MQLVRIGVMIPYVCAAFSSLAAGRIYEAPYASEADAAAWETVPWSEGLVTFKAMAPKETSRFKALYTDEALYVKVECRESQVKKIPDERIATEFWRCDVVELFAIPHRDEMIHLIGSARGNLNEEMPGLTAVRTRNMTGWDAKSEIGDDRWTIVFCVPLSLLGLDPSSGDRTMPFNVCRNAIVAKELTSWSPQLGGDFKDAQGFGRLVLKSAPAANAAAVKAGVSRPHIISLRRRWRAIRNHPLWKESLRSCTNDAAVLKELESKPELTREQTIRFADSLSVIERHESAERESLRKRIHAEFFGDPR